MNILKIQQRILVLCDIGDCDEAEQMCKVSGILHQAKWTIELYNEAQFVSHILINDKTILEFFSQHCAGLSRNTNAHIPKDILEE